MTERPRYTRCASCTWARPADNHQHAVRLTALHLLIDQSVIPVPAHVRIAAEEAGLLAPGEAP